MKIFEENIRKKERKTNINLYGGNIQLFNMGLYAIIIKISKKKDVLS